MHRRTTFLRGLALAAVLALAAGCGNGEEGEQPPLDPSPGEGTFGVSTIDNNFAPSRIEVPAGEEITIEVRNNGQNPHSFTIAELDVDTGVMDPGAREEVTLTVPEADPVEFVCTVHPQMMGTLQPS